MMHKLLLALLSLTLISTPAWSAKGGKQSIPQPNHVRLVDANGTMIGDAQERNDSDEISIYFDIDGDLYVVTWQQYILNGLAYTQPDCLGDPYVFIGPDPNEFGVRLLFHREGVFYTAGSNTPQTVTIASSWTTRTYEGPMQCLPSSSTGEWYPAAPLFEKNYAEPFMYKLIPAK